MQKLGVFESGQNAHRHFPENFAKYYLVEGSFYAQKFAFFANSNYGKYFSKTHN